MKLLLIGLLSVSCLLAGAGEQKKQNKAARTDLPAGVPAGAAKIAPETYHWTDKQGKTWIYRNTPFGIMKAIDPRPMKADGSGEPEEIVPADWTAAADGDNVRFERPSPFGKMSWTRKKSELTPFEQKLWDRESRKKAGAAGRE
jgi:hypothetical protein